MKWQEGLKAFQFYLKLERGLSQNSIDNYTWDIKKLIHYLTVHQIQTSPVKIDGDILKQFVYELAKTVKSPTQSRIISGLHSFFDFLILEGIRDKNPMELIEPPKKGFFLPETLSVNEIDHMVSTIDLNNRLGLRNITMIELLYSCGLRVSELVQLRISDLFLKESIIKVLGKGNKERFVPIADITKEYIGLYLEKRTEKVIPQKGHEDTLFLNNRGKDLTRAMIFTIIKKSAQKAGIQKKISPHTLRHSFASHLVENGADISTVQQLMGHASITTTERYLHMSKKKVWETLKEFHPRAY